MFRKSICCVVTLACLATGLVSVAWADGESRPARENEREFCLRVLQCFAKAHPAGPRGWDMVDQTEVVAPEYLGVGAEEYPLMVTYQVSWQDTPRLRAAQEKVVNTGAAIMKMQEGDQSSQRIQERFEKLVAELAAAMEKGDYQQAQKLQIQVEEVSKKLDAVYAGREEELRGVEEAYAPHDANLEIIFTANSFGEDFPKQFKAGPTVAGLKTYRTEGEQDPHNGWQEGITSVFIGDWRLVKDGDYSRMESSPGAEAPYDSVQTIVIQVQADEKRAAEVLAGIDWAALKGLGHE